VTTLQGALVTLRPPTDADVPELARIRATEQVQRWWRGGDDMMVAVADDLAQPNVETFVIEHESKVVGAIQWQAETEPDYLHASIDIYLDPAVHQAAIRCYTKVGFKPVGVMRQYERGLDGTWHDGLLMDLVAGDLTV
jgi:aminoglycoside 6'-N-acetyltransferase